MKYFLRMERVYPVSYSFKLRNRARGHPLSLMKYFLRMERVYPVSYSFKLRNRAREHPLSLMKYFLRMERVMGIEPTSQAWEARILPLYYTRENRIRYPTKILSDFTFH